MTPRPQPPASTRHGQAGSFFLAKTNLCWPPIFFLPFPAPPLCPSHPKLLEIQRVAPPRDTEAYSIGSALIAAFSVLGSVLFHFGPSSSDNWRFRSCRRGESMRDSRSNLTWRLETGRDWRPGLSHCSRPPSSAVPRPSLARQARGPVPRLLARGPPYTFSREHPSVFVASAVANLSAPPRLQKKGASIAPSPTATPSRALPLTLIVSAPGRLCQRQSHLLEAPAASLELDWFRPPWRPSRARLPRWTDMS